MSTFSGMLPWILILLYPALDIVSDTRFLETSAKDHYLRRSVTTILNVLTNVMVTGMIFFYIVRARRGLSGALPSRNLKPVTGVVALLIESALPVSIFGIMYAAILPVKRTTTDAWAIYTPLSTVFGFLFYSFTASSPLPAHCIKMLNFLRP